MWLAELVHVECGGYSSVLTNLAVSNLRGMILGMLLAALAVCWVKA
jgi:hypothetical protein